MVQEHLHHGNTYLANITFPTPVKTNLSFEQIFYHAHAPFKLFIPGRLVVFSPERFVRADRRFIRSYPMKGTIDAGIADARNKILKDPKETAEHFTIVDLIRNDLNLVSRRVEVRSFRYVDRIRTHGKELLQISSEIAGRIDIDFFNQLGSHIFKLLPAGSISGAPKQKTLEIIRLAEPFERGFFTGIFGYFGGTKLDSAVMIRFIEMLDGQTIYKSGGGITAWSRPDSEYQELIDKIYVPIH
jgi:para-aminobenzoate synthetase component 1